MPEMALLDRAVRKTSRGRACPAPTHQSPRFTSVFAIWKEEPHSLETAFGSGTEAVRKSHLDKHKAPYRRTTTS